MVVIDTCGWIEWLSNGQLSKFYEPYFLDAENILVPTTVQFELYKWVARNINKQRALEVIALTEQGVIQTLSTSITLQAADLALENKLSFADAIIYANAKTANVELVTSDNHFEGLANVVYFKKGLG